MNAATRTPDGSSGSCPVCGKVVLISPSIPLGDATCPHCGVLLYSESQGRLAPEVLIRLADLGVQIETDAEGEVIRIQLDGNRYSDELVPELAQLKGIPVINVHDTKISANGVSRLKKILPDSIIED
jgi:hypothetical protein